MYVLLETATHVECKAKYIQVYLQKYVHFNMIKEFEKKNISILPHLPCRTVYQFILKLASMIATILSLNEGLLTTILCIHNQYSIYI